ncbi:MAG: hypothetical protein ABFD52_04990 [Acidobacteriota bacterium]
MSMSLRKLEAEGAKKAGTKHGIRGLEKRGQVPMNLPSARSWKRTQARVREIYAAVRQRYGGDQIPADVEVLIAGAHDARLIRELGMLYVKRAGVMRGDSLAKGNLEMHSVLCDQLVAYSNLERLNLEAAARLASQKLPEGPILTIAEIIREHDQAEAQARPGNGSGDGQGELAPAPVENGPGRAQDERSSGGRGNDKGPEGPGPGGGVGEGGQRASEIAQERRSRSGAAKDQGGGEAGPENDA